MKYNCKECDFQWEGTSYTFEKVREHEKQCPYVVKFVTHQKLQMNKLNLISHGNVKHVAIFLMHKVM